MAMYYNSQNRKQPTNMDTENRNIQDDIPVHYLTDSTHPDSHKESNGQSSQREVYAQCFLPVDTYRYDCYIIFSWIKRAL